MRRRGELHGCTDSWTHDWLGRRSRFARTALAFAGLAQDRPRAQWVATAPSTVSALEVVLAMWAMLSLELPLNQMPPLMDATSHALALALALLAVRAVTRSTYRRCPWRPMGSGLLAGRGPVAMPRGNPQLRAQRRIGVGTEDDPERSPPKRWWRWRPQRSHGGAAGSTGGGHSRVTAGLWAPAANSRDVGWSPVPKGTQTKLLCRSRSVRSR